jgi:drug/metabolite transporter (DMT)-like permease
LFLFIAVLHQIIMGSSFVFARYVLGLLDPFAIAFLRFSISSVILCSFALWISARPGTVRIASCDRIKIALLGVLIIIFNQVIYLCGQKYTTASHGGLLFTMTPVFVYIIAMKHLGEAWSYKKGLGILLAVTGSVLIVLERGLDLGDNMLQGDAIILLAVIAWAYYTVYGKPLAEKYGAFRVTAYALGSGSAIYFPFGLYRLIAADMSRMDGYGWLSILYLAIGTSVIGYSTWYWLLKRMEAGRLSVLTNLQPIVAGVLGFCFLSEAITIIFVISGLIIIFGVTITQKA